MKWENDVQNLLKTNMGHYVKSVYIDIFTSIEAAAEKCAERRDVCVCVCDHDENEDEDKDKDGDGDGERERERDWGSDV